MVVNIETVEQREQGRQLVAAILQRQTRQQQEALAWAEYSRKRGQR